MANNVDIHFNFATTNSFVYCGKDFPFNMKLFNCLSDYFISNKNKIQQNGKINLFDQSDGNIIISDESIIDFINYCQNKTITLKDENIAALYKLSKKYMVTNLIEATENYILNHPDNFIIQYLTIIQTRQDLNAEQYEDLLSMNLPNYIQDDSLLILPFQTIYRVVTKYQLKYRNINHPNIIDFLFRCLNKYEKKASVLFENIDFTKENPSYLRQLLDEYSDKFDFNFIKTSNHKTMYEILSEIRQKEASIRSHEERISSQIQLVNDNLKEEIEKLKGKQNDMNTNIQQLQQKNAQQNDLILQLKAEILQLKRPRVSLPLLSNSNPKGIVSYLSEIVKLSAGRTANSNIENIKVYNNNYFTNYSSDYDQNKPDDGYIEFDFGSSNKVILHSYLIRSNGNSKSLHFHPKTWNIEGSNDHAHWIVLDNRVDDDSINGSFQQNVFKCQKIKYQDSTEAFRFIRYVQKDCWCDNMNEQMRNPYKIYITFFEFFGDVYQFCND